MIDFFVANINGEKTMKRITTLLIAMALGLALSACSKTEEGTAEKAGKQIDKAMEDTKAYTQEKMEQAGEAMKEAEKEATEAVSDAKEYTEEKMEQAGEAMEEAENEAGEAVSDAKEYTGEKVQEAGETLEKTGEEMQKND